MPLEIIDPRTEEVDATPQSQSHISDRLRVASVERIAVSGLPNLTDRIDAMGLTGEYRAYRERYQAWRNGSAEGAVGSLQASDLSRRYAGFGYWYPSKEVWAWRRTLSFWIAVTFFEGSVFFTVSSFLLCYEQHLAHYSSAVTTYGYIAGKVNFLLCTYLMCVETVNLSAGDDTVDMSFDVRPSVAFIGFEWWPFNVRTAVRRLKRLGAGPYPYYASIMYFAGVNAFLIGLVAEFLALPHDVASWIQIVSFIIGSTLFVLGGVAECIENEVFVKVKCCEIGWWGAILNTIGGVFFLLGSVFGAFSHLRYWGNVMFGVGSMIFAIGAGTMIIMWKDEQFGLTFLSALNKLGGAHGRPLLLRDGETVVREPKTFSCRGAIFIIIYILAANVSTYDGLLSLAEVTTENMSFTKAVSVPFYSFLPCIFAHALLAINCAVVKVPADPPFRELYIFCRFLAVIMVVICMANLVETLHYASYIRA